MENGSIEERANEEVLIRGVSEKERAQIVNRLLGLLKSKYKDDLLFFGLKGSMARGDYDSISDIDAVAIIKKGKSISESMQFRDIPLDVTIYTYADAKKKVTDLSGGWWPYVIGGLLEPKIIFEKGNVITKLNKEADKLRIKPERFLQECVINGYYEYYSKAIKDYRSKNYAMLRYDAWELFIMACIDLGLINQQYYTIHGPNVLNQLDRMKKFLPKDFREKASLCFHDSIHKVFEGCTYIFKETKRWQKKFGYDKLPQHKVFKSLKEFEL